MEKGITKLFLSITLSNVIRLFSFIPNNDPIMALMLPYAKQKNLLVTFLFPFITMFSFDVLKGQLSILTLVTALTYGGLGLMFSFIYKNRKVKVGTYLCSGAIGVLIFDFVTGCVAFPILFNIPFWQAILGQIPFTLIHLATVSAFILIITPILDKHILKNAHLTDVYVRATIGALFTWPHKTKGN